MEDIGKQRLLDDISVAEGLGTSSIAEDSITPGLRVVRGNRGLDIGQG